MTKENLQQKLEVQLTKVTHIKSCFEIWKGLHNKFQLGAEYNTVFQKSPYFWNLTLQVFQERFLLEVAKLYDENKDCLGIKKMINICEQNQKLFPKEHRRKLYNHFEEKEIENIVSVDIVSVIQSAKNRYNTAQDTRRRLITLRDKYLAHADKKYVEDPNNLYQEIALNIDAFKKLLNVADEILNILLIALTDRCHSLDHLNRDDYNYLLAAAHNGIEKTNKEVSHDQS